MTCAKPQIQRQMNGKTQVIDLRQDKQLIYHLQRR